MIITGIGLQVEKVTQGSVDDNKNIIFDSIVNNLSSNITYDLETGIITINKNGAYYISWMISVQTALGNPALKFSIITSDGREVSSGSPMKTGEVGGFTLIEIVNAPATVKLVNKTGEMVSFATFTDVKSNLIILESVESGIDQAASKGVTGGQGAIGTTGVTGKQGLMGTTEATGEQGLIGTTGATGEQEQIGTTGVTREQGSIGPVAPYTKFGGMIAQTQFQKGQAISVNGIIPFDTTIVPFSGIVRNGGSFTINTPGVYLVDWSVVVGGETILGEISVSLNATENKIVTSTVPAALSAQLCGSSIVTVENTTMLTLINTSTGVIQLSDAVSVQCNIRITTLMP
ncbi:hypothetical protein [Clostridium sardiniense]|uniref:hypothetical protein n=1 Tax=Clostridium sardiniense TaxID=29369 RepID=UPI003D326439